MPNDRNEPVIAEFRANGGHVAAFGKQPLLLLHTIGAKSGAQRVNPLACLRRGDKWYIFASANARPVNPDWYRNVVANPDVTVETGDETFPARARVLTAAERDDVYAEQAAANPAFADYERRTSRVIPVIELTRA
jgi:deazaflavin-dependent oxidoreductase (nitroreductase family)